MKNQVIALQKLIKVKLNLYKLKTHDRTRTE
jgi:hypothetical protein